MGRQPDPSLPGGNDDSGLFELPVAAAQAQMLGVEHVGVQVLPHLFQVELRQDVLLQIGRRNGRGQRDREGVVLDQERSDA